ncbi:MAG TPA: hypothetical protein DG754_11355 [Bacteroidales bacterium]|jgi:hypothetical protein|nr:hypothetical protein [Bacteroidales bacterium]
MKNLILTAYAVLLSFSLIQAQEGNEATDKSSIQEKFQIKLKDGVKSDIYVDEKKFDFPLDLLDANKIALVSVITGEKAMKEYNSKNGVLLIVTKKKMEEIRQSKGKVKDYSTMENAPVVIINGEKSDQGMLQKISPDDIERIDIIKGEEALEKYNAANGVIIVTTKKGEKK